MSYQIGKSKVDTTFFREHCGMLGYGRHFHYMRGVETKQWSRAYVFKDAHKKFVIICVDFCFSTDNLKAGIIAKLQTEYPDLGYCDANVMILGQHTHSAAGGFGQYLAYNLTMPGFQEDVYDHYKDKIVEAIVEAEKNIQTANIRRHEGTFDEEAEVAFNRSIHAYNANADVTEKRTMKKRHLAVDRTMKLLRMDTEDGKPFGTMNWFGVHTTSVSNRRDKVCYDNKGYAADYFEDYLKEQYGEKSDIFSVFAQDAAGDVSPNYIYSRKTFEYRGKHEDDYESAAYNGKLQFEKAKEIFEQAATQGELIEGDIDYALMYADMTHVNIDEEYTGGLKHESTSWASFGLAFLEGTTDGRGFAKVAGALLKPFFHLAHQVEILAGKLRRNKEVGEEIVRHQIAQRPKTIFMNGSTGYVIGTPYPDKIILPGGIDPVIKYIKQLTKTAANNRPPWLPERMPIQLLILGQLVFIGVPSEITTIAGQRLRNTVLEVLKERGVTQAILCPYANAYAGYITTYEEYRQQNYEGGHTLYGKWTLAAYQMQFRNLARELLKPADERQALGVEPFLLSKDQLWYGFSDASVRVM